MNDKPNGTDREQLREQRVQQLTEQNIHVLVGNLQVQLALANARIQVLMAEIEETHQPVPLDKPKGKEAVQ